ncbi:rod shape-determining protein MreC [Candidatus Endolissoclinum faulkneri L2]|uniref:Cell shape-determining protein MreC n=1 Tax=Candidatus Endolissoclinum faulkneri L2 TaxID=1193729 RepID=K7YSJ4_9PROT|nr:rod shape-determining protein MreC [Candidatus Endolissoclinum faulkneri]AFX99489.1 rod shape-determining protein MreC [Candidatus Endolissoclinum faulkneri L2]
MAKRPGSFNSLTQPVRSLWSYFAFTILLITSFILMLLGKVDVFLIDNARTIVLDALAPAIEVAAGPISFLNKLMKQIGDLRYLQAENSRLILENQQLYRWQHIAQLFEAENLALRSLTNFIPPKDVDFVSARVIGDGNGVFVRNIMITAGNKDGLTLGNAVVSGEGLVGGVIEVGESYSRVLLITDLNSSIPIQIDRTRDPGLLIGDNTRTPRIIYLPLYSQVVLGDRIVTSGHGGVFPSGLGVGVVTMVNDGLISVTPFVDWERLEYVSILKTGYDGIARSDTSKLLPSLTRRPKNLPCPSK